MKKLFAVAFVLALLVLFVNANPNLNVITDKQVAENSTLNFNFTCSAPDNGTTVFSKNISFGTLTKISNTTANFQWTPGFSDAGAYSVKFLANDTNSSSNTTFTITVNNTNRRPIANAGPDRTGYTNTTFYLNGTQSSDPDNSSLTYFWRQTGGATVNLSSTTASVVSFLKNVTGTYTFSLIVNDGTVNSTADSVTVTINSISKLEINDLDVKVDGKSSNNLEDGETISRDFEPESEVEFRIKVKNLFSSSDDVEIQDILVKVTIENIDDGDDLEEESDEFDLNDGKSKTVKLNFDIPIKVDEGDYDVKIEITGRDENGHDHEVNWNLKATVDKKSHDLRITNFKVVPSTMSCLRTGTVDIKVSNAGNNDEDEALVEVVSSQLGINFNAKNLEIDEGDSYSKTITFTLDDDFKAGTYPISANVYYDTTRSQDSATANLVVEDCKSTSSSSSQQQTKDEKEDDKQTSYAGTTTTSSQSFAVPVATESSFRDSTLYFVLLIAGVVVIIALIVAAFAFLLKP